MKVLLIIGLAILLCSCGAAPQVHTSLNYNDQSMPTMDLTSPKFYMDDDKPPLDAFAPSRRNSIDGFCASNCQSHSNSAGYCNRACGF